jgi:hypothetical protein
MAKRSAPVLSAPVGAGARTDLADHPAPDTAHLEIPPGQFYVSAVQLAHRFGSGGQMGQRAQAPARRDADLELGHSKLRYYLPTADAYMPGRTLAPVEKRRRPRAKRGSGGGGEGLIQFV